jgi:hypothetical protein
MVNKVVLEYLRMHRGNYKLDDLKRKIIASGYSPQNVNDAMLQLNKESSGGVPGVNATINKINKTNINVNGSEGVSKSVGVVKPKKKKSSWLKWLIIIWVVLLVLAGIGFGLWFYFSG